MAMRAGGRRRPIPKTMDHVVADLSKLLIFHTSLPANIRRRQWWRTQYKAAKQMIKIGRAAIGELPE